MPHPFVANGRCVLCGQAPFMCGGHTKEAYARGVHKRQLELDRLRAELAKAEEVVSNQQLRITELLESEKLQKDRAEAAEARCKEQFIAGMEEAADIADQIVTPFAHPAIAIRSRIEEVKNEK